MTKIIKENQCMLNVCACVLAHMLAVKENDGIIQPVFDKVEYRSNSRVFHFCLISDIDYRSDDSQIATN